MEDQQKVFSDLDDLTSAKQEERAKKAKLDENPAVHDQEAKEEENSDLEDCEERFLWIVSRK